MKGFILDYINENEFRKLERSLKKYNMPAYKKLNFDYYPSLRSGIFLGELVSSDSVNKTETYELRLPSDLFFTQVHGEVKLKYIIKDKVELSLLEKYDFKKRYDVDTGELIKYVSKEYDELYVEIRTRKLYVHDYLDKYIYFIDKLVKNKILTNDMIIDENKLSELEQLGFKKKYNVDTGELDYYITNDKTIKISLKNKILDFISISSKDTYFLKIISNLIKNNILEVKYGENIETNELKLQSDLFEKVHGEIKLRYIVYKDQNVVMLDTIMPTDILLEGHVAELSTYKGVMISKQNAEKDKFMINLFSALDNNKK